MIVSLFGPDSYRRMEKQRELVRAYRAKYRHADEYAVDLEDTPDDWTRARDFLRQPSMFVASKLLVVREPGSVDVEEWSTALKNAVRAEGVTAILSAKDDPADSFAFLAGSGVVKQEFREPSGRILEAFVLREAKTYGLSFAPAALSFFLSALETQPDRSARATNELARIALAKFSMPIEKHALETLVPWTPREEVFRGVRTMLGAREPRARLAAFEAASVAGNAAAYFFNSLAYQARGTDLVALAAYDVAVKSGTLEYEEALTDFSVAPPSSRETITRAESFLRDVI